MLTNAEEARRPDGSKIAERELRQALAAAPRDVDVLFKLGSLLCEQDRAESISLLRQATRQSPAFADAW